MDHASGRTLVSALEVFRGELTRPSLRRLAVIFVGWVLTQGPHAITEALVAAGVAGVQHHAAFHRFFSRARWNADHLGGWLWMRIRKLFPEQPIRLVLDDTLVVKKGPEVFGLGVHLDPVHSTRGYKVFCFGHVWVVLAVLVKFPFSRSAWALPLLFRLYRSKKECARGRAAYRTKTELARELLKVFHGFCRGERIEVTADLAYCCATVTCGLPDNIVLIGAMRPDAVLTAAPPKRTGKGGRPAKRGEALPKPTALAKSQDVPWQHRSAHLYGKDTNVTFKDCLAQWYRACGERLLHVVVVQCPHGNVPLRVYFSTDPSMGVVEILEIYSGRWGIEVCFRNIKQLLGFADSSARSPWAVRRTAPMVGLFYTILVLWFANHAAGTALATPPNRPWYRHKRGVCFTDVLRAAQRALRQEGVVDLRWIDEDLPNTRARAPRPRKGRLRMPS